MIARKVTLGIIAGAAAGTFALAGAAFADGNSGNEPGAGVQMTCPDWMCPPSNQDVGTPTRGPWSPVTVVTDPAPTPPKPPARHRVVRDGRTRPCTYWANRRHTRIVTRPHLRNGACSAHA